MIILRIFCYFLPILYAKRYKIITLTGNPDGAGTDANIFINIFGSKRESGLILLKAENRDIFERNEIDTFIVDTEELGTLEKIVISNDMSSEKPAWFLDKVIVNTQDGDFYEFPLYSWVNSDFSKPAQKEILAHQYKRSLFEKINEPENLEPLGCHEPLGMHDGKISDEQITASTSFNDLHLPYHARLNMVYPNSFGGWCPFKENKDEFLQIDLIKLKNLTGIATQGLGLVDEWTTSYFLKYKSSENFDWKFYEVNNKEKIFFGNTDQNTSTQHWLFPSISTKTIRIYPQDFHGKACLRIELFGCDINTKLDLKSSKVIYDDDYRRSSTNISELLQENINYNEKYSANPTLKPVIYINFDNISNAGVIQDISGYNNDVKVHSPVDIIPFSRSCGPGIRLDGGFLIVDGEFFVYKPTNAISILVWIKLFTNSGQHSIFNTWSKRGFNSISQVGYRLEVDKGRVKWLYFDDHETSALNLSTGLQIPAHVWTHIGVTYDSKSGKGAIFVNSKLAVQTKTEIKEEILPQDWSGGALIGRSKDSKSLNGEMDEFYIFRESLSPSKIQSIMKKCLFEIDCKEPIGMESNAIPDDHITASSSYNLHFPFYSRLNQIGINGDPARTAWCADGKDINPYIEVDMAEIKTITGISIQGLGLFDNWVTSFMVCFSMNENGTLFCVKENGIDKTFEGNNDKNSIVHYNLKYPIATQKIRIKPVSWFGNHLCMRLELFGCSQDLFPDPFDNGGSINMNLMENEEIIKRNIPENCNRPLGISSGELDDTHFSASSELNSEHQSRFSRLIRDYPTEEISPHTFINYSHIPRTTWCSNEVNLRQYIEIDLGEIKNVTQIATQGYYMKENWVTTFRIGSSDETGPIRWYSEDGIDKIFNGNSDAKHIVKNYFLKPIRARFIRVNPRSWVGSHICLRLELYGCSSENVSESFKVPSVNKKADEQEPKNKVIPAQEKNTLEDLESSIIPILFRPPKIIQQPNFTKNLNMFATQTIKPQITNDDLSFETLNNQNINEILNKSEENKIGVNKDITYWDNIIKKYPELTLHKVTADLLESMSKITPDLNNKIEEYFREKSPYKSGNELLKNLNEKSNDFSDSRKGLIEHFIANNWNHDPENDTYGNFKPWNDPNHNTWSQFTECSQNCGIGIKMRQRTCDYPVCQSPGVETEIEPCYVHSCDEYGSEYSQIMWSPFTPCSRACGVGHSMRFRMCDGIICPIPGYQTQTISCFMPKCPVCNYNFESFEESKIILDVSGTGNNAILEGDAFISNHDESCGHFLDLNFTGRLILPDQTFRTKPKVGITIALWLKLRQTSGIASIFATEISNGPDQFLGTYHLEIVDGRIRWFLRNERSDIIFNMETSDIFIQPLVWMHLCVTYDTITLTGNLYIDGQKKYNFNGYNMQALISDWGARALIGDYDFDSRHLNGYIDDFYMFDYAISQNQVSDLIVKSDTC